jgi:uncharacterized membrane protein
MVAFDVSAMADTAWMLALAAMAMGSLKAWRAIPPGAWVPLQWGAEGVPSMMTSRSLAVLFTPVSAVVGGLLLAAGERLAGPEAPHGLTLLRFIAPVFLVFAHRAYLSGAVDGAVAEADA